MNPAASDALAGPTLPRNPWPVAMAVLLATFMGHVEPRYTEVYLTITGELLQQAGDRFHQHFGLGIGKEVLP